MQKVKDDRKYAKAKEESNSTKMKRGADGKSDKFNSKRVHDVAQESGGKEVSLVTLK